MLKKVLLILLFFTLGLVGVSMWKKGGSHKGSLRLDKETLIIALKNKDVILAEELIARMPLQEETIYAKALLSYLKRDFAEMARHVRLIEKTALLNSHFFLFKGLERYFEKDFFSTCSYFNHYIQEKREERESWLSDVIKNHFSPSWIEIHLAHAYMERGEMTKSFELLQKWSSEPFARLLLGFYYLQESASFSFVERKNSLERALYYLEEERPSFLEETLLLPHLTKEIMPLMQREEGFSYAARLIHLLERKREKKELDAISQKMVERVFEEPNSFALAVKKEFEKTLFYDLLLEKSGFAFEKKMQEKSLLNPFETWEKLQTLSSSYAHICAKKMGDFVAPEILRSLHEEGLYSRRVHTLIDFWKMIETSSERRSAFARMLFQQGVVFWKKEKQEEEGSALFKMAIEIAEKELKGRLVQEMEAFFKLLFQQAMQANLVDRMLVVYEAASSFRISFRHISTPSEVANRIADADYLFKVQNYLSSKVHAEWILKLDPENEKALKLLGLSQFYLGDYTSSCHTLCRIHLPDEEVKKALLLSQSHFAENQKIARLETVVEEEL